MGATNTPTPTSTQVSDPAVSAFLCQSLSEIHAKFSRINEHETNFIKSLPNAAFADPVSFKRNRWNKIRPWNHNRVQLKENEEIIATHGPMDDEAGRFWRLVIQERSEVILMLTQPWENGEEKCSVYYPETVGQLRVVDEEMGLRVECLRIFEESGTEIRELKISIKEKEERIVWHLLFPAWADMKAPQKEDEKKILDLIKMSRFRIDDVEYDKKQTSSGPRIVHCSAGCGRTGTFIALDYLLQEMVEWKKNGTVEGDPVFEAVKKLREQRLKTVYKKEQLSFLYQILKGQWEEQNDPSKRQLPSMAETYSIAPAVIDVEDIFGEEMEILVK